MKKARTAGLRWGRNSARFPSGGLIQKTKQPCGWYFKHAAAQRFSFLERSDVGPLQAAPTPAKEEGVHT